MNELELKQMVERVLRDMTGQGAAPCTGGVRPSPLEPAADPDHFLPDITKIDLRQQYLVEHPQNKEAFLALKTKTPARLGMGRAGARYRTATALRMRADHAAAQDSVFSHVDENYVKQQGWVFTQTLCKDKDEYLTRPDLGRRFDQEQQAVIRQTCGQNPRVLLVVGDGLSSAATEANAADCAAAIRQGLSGFGIPLGETLFVKYCRVGASDAIGDVTGTDLVCMLVGERPGLVTAESMSAYLTYQPRIGVPESRRTVVSNIHRQGTPAVEAGAHIAELIRTILEKKASGVELQRMGQGVGA